MKEMTPMDIGPKSISFEEASLNVVSLFFLRLE